MVDPQEEPEPKKGPVRVAPKEVPLPSPLTFSDVGTVAVKYIALAVGLGALAFAIKALLLVGMNTEVAAALVASSSPSTVMQMLLEVIPLVGILLFLALMYQVGRLSLQGMAQAAWIAPLVLLALTVIAPVIMLLGWETVWFVLIPIYGLYQAVMMGRSRRGGHYVRTVVPLICLIGFAFVVTPGMWLPEEQLRVAGKDYLAYVTSESEDSVVAYFPANKAVVRLKESTVEKRQYCRVQAPYVTFGSMWKGAPNLPECPKDDQVFPIK